MQKSHCLIAYLPSFTFYTNKATMRGKDILWPCTSEYSIAGAWNDSFTEQLSKKKNSLPPLESLKGINTLLLGIASATSVLQKGTLYWNKGHGALITCHLKYVPLQHVNAQIKIVGKLTASFASSCNIRTQIFWGVHSSHQTHHPTILQYNHRLLLQPCSELSYVLSTAYTNGRKFSEILKTTQE